MTPYYEDDAVTIYHGDCLDVITAIGRPTAGVVTDPPYGMNWNTDSSRFSGGEPSSVRRRGRGRTDWGAVRSDDQPFDPSPWLDHDEVILWGSNHFASRLPVGTTLVWIKRLEDGYGSFLSDAELAWMKGGHGVYCRRDTSLMSHTGNRWHPTEKPLGLMKWCIGKTKADVILDPFMGSGTTLRAAKDLGRKAIGIELEEHYCEIAARRMGQEVLDLGMPA